MEICEQLTTVRNIIQAILKAKKIVNLYPENNPIYIKALKELSDRFSEFFQDNESLKLNIDKNTIFYDSESVYQNSAMLDNLALLFFKDGVRELTFKNGLTAKETEAFIKIISLDFEKDTIDEDVVTLFWEKDLDNIQYIVEDQFLSDDYEKKAMDELQQKTSTPESIEEIYSAIFSEEEGSKNEIILPVTDEDFHSLLEEFDKHNQDKTDKSLNMLFELFSEVEKEQEYLDIVNYFKMFIEFFIKKGNINAVVDVQSRLKKLIDNERTDREIRKCAVKLLSFTGGYSIIDLIGNILNSSQKIEENVFKSFVSFLDTNAILPFMKLLGELKAIHTRKLVIDALVYLGKKDISSLYKGLNDPRWYVVRNMAYILRKINDKNAFTYLLKPLEHEDIRVRKEVIRTLGELGGDKAITSLQRCLHDNNIHVRKTALSALGNTGAAAAKQIIMEQISDKAFNDNSFDEKKQYFEALANWKDRDVYDFLVKMLSKRSFFPGSKDYDNKACAVYCLGLIGRKDAIPILNEYKNNSNKLLREYSFSAVQRIENGI
ncbi:MAG: HEAT repeat domain-containing protein [Nitrospirae bacterium]|nr:HEAT repeat domain-containing protein [Nitrospirota bacterium]